MILVSVKIRNQHVGIITATADNPQPGKADADATFMINYN